MEDEVADFIRIRKFQESDIFRFNNINLDRWTEMYQTGFYYDYLARHSELCIVAETKDGVCLAGYLIAKIEGEGENYHSHISALSVAPEFRRCGIARMLQEYFEAQSNARNCIFADLFVRVSNELAIAVYKKRGYVVYRRVLGYYSGTEDAFDMRLPLAVDAAKKSIEGAGFSIDASKLLYD